MFSGLTDQEVMALGLGKQRGIQRRVKRADGVGRVAQGSAQVEMIVLPEALIDPASTRQADPVAARAKIVRQRSNEAEPPTRFCNPVISRRACEGIASVFRFQRPSTLQVPLHNIE